MQMKIAHGILVTAAIALAGCSSHPVVPDKEAVKVSRDDADKDCRELGPVQGSVTTTKGTVEQAIDDMKLDAARKGANYVRMQATSAMGTSVSGTAYICQ
ncbi:MAG: DUF4156 domain-containing protein [Bdellovibrionaceae bacterium]|nr:DUF4156 domain-containing protein [Pseudobdellovibrionaceae bacterium]